MVLQNFISFYRLIQKLYHGKPWNLVIVPHCVELELELDQIGLDAT